ncbi:polysaccharide biosynthesis protein [Jannaschia sp. Os4]|uniref:polysaccharide biosynthesis protein n=1 Tax=Jannaschia sp. Os4 TaxID=2807617 RepID=UPI00193A52AB|nr:polysaccharide biosynthesis protein [Jannaschia sp. Os4]MBM2575900.1 polysaccharide biosynthesis protein [Jannaschia sp. Os4]
MALSEDFKGAAIAITGGAGSVGRTVVRKLIDDGVGLLRVIDNNEALLFDMEQEYRDVSGIEFYCCDVADESELTRCFSNIRYVFHMAALKHVPICERSPFSAVNVNIRGTETVIRAAVRSGVRRVLFTSTDKAVNPTNVMGTSKLMGERLFTAADSMGGRDGERPIFASTRFGNVAGTRGSVIPLFAEQIARGGPVTLTDERMTRFVMTQSRAAELVIESIRHAQGGEVFITKMPALNVVDLARVMIDMLAPLHGHDPASIETRVIGARPGEKLWEELSTDEESARIFEGTEYLVVKPPFERITHAEARRLYPTLDLRDTSMTYHSEHVERMTDREIADFLLEEDVLDAETRARLLESQAPRKEAV